METELIGLEGKYLRGPREEGLETHTLWAVYAVSLVGSGQTPCEGASSLSPVEASKGDETERNSPRTWNLGKMNDDRRKRESSAK